MNTLKPKGDKKPFGSGANDNKSEGNQSAFGSGFIN